MRKTLAALFLSLVASLAVAVPKVAVLNPTLDKGIDEKVGLIIVDKILEELLNSNGFDILDRASRDVIWQERNFQLSSGEVDTAQIKEIGKGLGADYIVTVKLVRIGKVLAMSAQLIDVQTLEVIKAASAEASDDLENTIALATQCGSKLAGRSPAKKPVPAKAPAKKAAEAYLFDSSLRSTKVPIGDSWFPLNDSGSGGNTSTILDTDMLQTGILHFSYRIGDKLEYPYAMLAASMGGPKDLGKYSAIEVTYRGKGTFRVEFATEEVKDYNYHSFQLPAAADAWRTVKVPLKSLAQADWAPVKVAFSQAHVTMIQFSAAIESKKKDGSGWLELTSVKLVE